MEINIKTNNYDNYYGKENQPINKNNTTIKGTDDKDFFNIKGDDVTIKAKAGNDYIDIHGFNNIVDAGSGDDIIDLWVCGSKNGDYSDVQYSVTGGEGSDIFKFNPSNTYLNLNTQENKKAAIMNNFAEITITDFDKDADKIDLSQYRIKYEDLELSDSDELYIKKYINHSLPPLVHNENQISDVSYPAERQLIGEGKIVHLKITLEGMKWSDLDESNFVEISYDIEA